MAESEETQSLSGSRTRSQDQSSTHSDDEEQSQEQEISQPSLLLRIRIRPTATQRTRNYRCPVCGYDFPSEESLSEHMPAHWVSSSSSGSETEHKEFQDLSNYLPRWPVKDRRGRRSLVGIREKQETSCKKSAIKSETIGNRAGYPEKKLTIGERACRDGDIGNSVKVKNVLEKGKQKAVMESNDDFKNTRYPNSIILSEEPPMSNKPHKKKRKTKSEHPYKNISSEKDFRMSQDLTDHTKWHCNDPKKVSPNTVKSSPTGPKVLPFDLNDLPSVEDEDDATEY